MREIQNFLGVLCACLAIFLIRIYFGAGHIPDRSPRPAKPLKFFEIHYEEPKVSQSAKNTPKMTYFGLFHGILPFLGPQLGFERAILLDSIKFYRFPTSRIHFCARIELEINNWAKIRHFLS